MFRAARLTPNLLSTLNLDKYRATFNRKSQRSSAWTNISKECGKMWSIKKIRVCSGAGQPRRINCINWRFWLILTGWTLFVSQTGGRNKGQWTVSRISAWGFEANVNKFCTEAEEGSRTINKIKPITSTEAPSVSLFPAAVKKKRPAGHRNLLFPVREHQHGC